MATSFLDPLQMWRDAVTKLEGEVNSIATGSTKHEDVVRALHQFSAVSLGMEQVLERVIGGYLRRANLPSRKEVLELAESLRRIEDKVDRLLPPEAAALPAPRPPRTRRPSSAAEPRAPGEAATAGDARAPAAARAAAEAPAPTHATAEAPPAKSAKTGRSGRSAKPAKPAKPAERRPVRRAGG